MSVVIKRSADGGLDVAFPGRLAGEPPVIVNFPRYPENDILQGPDFQGQEDEEIAIGARVGGQLAQPDA